MPRDMTNTLLHAKIEDFSFIEPIYCVFSHIFSASNSFKHKSIVPPQNLILIIIHYDIPQAVGSLSIRPNPSLVRSYGSGIGRVRLITKKITLLRVMHIDIILFLSNEEIMAISFFLSIIILYYIII